MENKRSPDEAIGDFERGDAATITRLAQLSRLNYARARKQEAKRLGCPVSELDALVARERDGDAAQAVAGQGMKFDDPPPADHPVNGSELLDDLADRFSRYAKLPEHADTALALWAVFTYLLDAAPFAPILAITSPMKRCGKTTLLGVLSRLVYRRLSAANISPAALFRVIEAHRPTLLIDEADTFLKANDELRGLLNCGHSRDAAFTLRIVAQGDDFEARQFSTWGAKAIALIGKLSGTLADRAIEVRLVRRKRGEPIERLGNSNADDWAQLKRRVARFAADHQAAIAAARPVIPGQLHDRAADNWRPLLSIADVAGGQWPERARAAAVAMTGADDDDDALGVELLRDIRAVFVARAAQVPPPTDAEKISSADLIDALVVDPEKAWATIEHGKPLTQRGLARRLRLFDIKPKNIRIGVSVTKGYELDAFADLFERYLG